MLADTFVGLRAALRARLGTFALVSVAVGALSVAVPPLLLSVVRKPVDFFTVNPWLRRLPDYLASSEHTAWIKLEKLSNLALFWFSADSPYGGTEWGFAVDVRDLGRIALTSVLVGAYFALWCERRAMLHGGSVPVGLPVRAGAGAGRAGGFAGALAGVLGLSTGPCSVVGCGAPVLPVVGLAFTGLSSGTLTLLSGVSVIATTAIFAVLLVATAHLAWRVGATRRRAGAAPGGRRG